MIRRAPAFLFLVLCAPAAAFAVTRITIDPPPPFYEDDIAKIIVWSDEPNEDAAFDVRGRNISLIRGRGTGSFDGRTRVIVRVWDATFYAVGPGTLDIKAPGRIEGPSHLEFEVRPALTKSWSDPSELVRLLAAAQRPVSIVLAEARPKVAYVGDRVHVTWWAITPDPKARFLASDPLRMRLRASAAPPQAPQSIALGGVMLWKVPLLRADFPAEKAGTIEIPEMKFEGLPLSGATETAPQYVRLSNALRIEVKPPLAQAAGGLPIGPLTIECSDPERLAYWPAQIVTITRGQSLKEIRLEFDPPLSYPVVVSRAEPAEPRFIMSAHARDLKAIPTPLLRYFDAETGTAKVATCSRVVRARTVQQVRNRLPETRRSTFEQSLNLADRSSPLKVIVDPARLKTAMNAGRIVFLLFAIAGIAGVVMAWRV